MTPEAINRAVAEACGIKPTTKCPQCYGTGFCGSELDHEPCRKCKSTGQVEPFYDAYDYFRDLNACREMERTLSLAEALRYDDMLRRAATSKMKWDSGSESFAWNASSETRTEMFLKVKGLWRDE